MNKIRALRGATGSLLVAVLALAAPPPVHATEAVARLVESLTVDATDSDGTWTVNPLLAGKQYELQVAGTYTYGQGDSAADAECSQLKPDEAWNRNRYVAMTSYEDLLDMYLDNGAVDWQPSEADSLGCNSFNHTYTFRFVMPETRNIRLYLRDVEGSYYENAGSLVVRINQIEGEATAPPSTPSPAAPPAARAEPAPAPAGSALAPLPPRAQPAPLVYQSPAPPPPAAGRDELALSGLPTVPLPVEIPGPRSAADELVLLLAVAALTAVSSALAGRLRQGAVPRRTVRLISR